MTVPVTTVHTTGQRISSAEWDRTIALIKNGILEYPSGMTSNLQNQIGMEELTPGLRDFLSALVANVAGFTKDPFVADGTQYQFRIRDIPSAGSELVYRNGDLLDGADYVFEELDLGSGLLPYLVLEEVPLYGDKIVVIYRSSNTLNAGVIGSYHVHHNDISAVFSSNTNSLTMLGKRMDSPTGVREFFTVRVDSMSVPTGTSVVNSIPTSERDWPDAVQCGDYIWAIGDAGTGLNTITKVHVDTLASTGYTLTTDAAATITAIATDNAYVYAFMKHSTYTYPNSFIKVTQNGVVSGLIYSGLTVTGDVSVCVGNNGYLYASFADASVKQVRKYDVSPTNGFQKAFQLMNNAAIPSAVTPTMVYPVDTYIYVISAEGFLHRISTTDTVTLLQDYTFVPSNIYYDGANLWISSDDVLYKCDKLGNILQNLEPAGNQNIQVMRGAYAFLWTTYIDETSNTNLTKLYPGLPNI